MDDMLSMNSTTEYIARLESLKEQYKDNYITRKNGTVLLGPSSIPRSRHMLFVGLDDETIKTFLEENYKNSFPEEYKTFLRYSNGANLYTVRVKTANGLCFAHNLFSIYGLPRTPPFGRPQEMEEPFDLRIEDLARHKKTPKTWLKCGSYCRDCNIKVDTSIFIDTADGKVYACNKNECDVLDSWGSFDECFCSIFDSLADSQLEYQF